MVPGYISPHHVATFGHVCTWWLPTRAPHEHHPSTDQPPSPGMTAGTTKGNGATVGCTRSQMCGHTVEPHAEHFAGPGIGATGVRSRFTESVARM